jgi:membrane fusion protein (multidrug efflux system)
MKKKVILSLTLVLVVVAVLAGVKATQIRTLLAAGKVFVTPPESVSSAVARVEKWQDSLPAVGSIAAVQGVTIAAEFPGTVREIAFESGAVVAKDDLLIKLDTSSEEAQLRALEAQVEWAHTNVIRIHSLRSENTVSQAELDQAETALKQYVANADNVRATIAKKTMRAPFAGRLGIRQVNLGQYLEAAKPVVSLQSLAPVYGDFSLPQQELARLQTGLRVRITTDTYPDQVFDGTLTAINPDLDPVTRSVRVQATFENSEHRLRPGMFARLEVMFPETQPVLVIPATSVLSAPYGDSVYVIEPGTNAAGGLVVRQQFVRLGRAKGDYVSVVSGLKPGERVASSGLFKLRNKMSVVESNELTPKSDRKPTPSDS